MCQELKRSFVHSDSRGKVVKPLQYQSTVAPGTVARVEPNIKWFGEKCLYCCVCYSVYCKLIKLEVIPFAHLLLLFEILSVEFVKIKCSLQ